MSGASEQVWDAGLQPERTSLAWLRLGLALVALAFAIPRFAWPILGAWSLVPALVVAATALVLIWRTERRYRAVHATLVRNPDRGLPDGRLPLAATLVTLVLAAVGALVVVAGALGAT